MKPEQLEVWRKRWRTDELLLVGEDIFAHISDEVRPLWAAEIVEFCLEHTEATVELDELLTIARSPERWREGHGAFGKIRDQTLIYESSSKVDPSVGTLLYVAEIAAKVIYNASGEPAPFDADSGAWMAKNLSSFVDASGCSDEEAWAVLVRPLAND